MPLSSEYPAMLGIIRTVHSTYTVHTRAGLDLKTLGVYRQRHSPMLVEPVLRSFHHQKPRQNMDEYPFNPWSHPVRLWRAEVHIQHDHRHADTETKFTSVTNVFKDWPWKQFLTESCFKKGQVVF